MIDSKFAKLLALSNKLRKNGFNKYADELEYNFLILKKSETNLYSVFKEVGESLLSDAHPEGSVNLFDGDKDLSEVEDLIDQKKKIMKVVSKQPTGKLASAAKIIVTAGVLGEMFDLIRTLAPATVKAIGEDVVKASLTKLEAAAAKSDAIAFNDAWSMLKRELTSKAPKNEAQASAEIEKTLIERFKGAAQAYVFKLEQTADDFVKEAMQTGDKIKAVSNIDNLYKTEIETAANASNMDLVNKLLNSKNAKLANIDKTIADARVESLRKDLLGLADKISQTKSKFWKPNWMEAPSLKQIKTKLADIRDLDVDKWKQIKKEVEELSKADPESFSILASVLKTIVVGGIPIAGLILGQTYIRPRSVELESLGDIADVQAKLNSNVAAMRDDDLNKIAPLFSSAVTAAIGSTTKENKQKVVDLGKQLFTAAESITALLPETMSRRENIKAQITRLVTDISGRPEPATGAQSASTITDADKARYKTLFEASGTKDDPWTNKNKKEYKEAYDAIVNNKTLDNVDIKNIKYIIDYYKDK